MLPEKFKKFIISFLVSVDVDRSFVFDPPYSLKLNTFSASIPEDLNIDLIASMFPFVLLMYDISERILLQIKFWRS